MHLGMDKVSPFLVAFRSTLSKLVKEEYYSVLRDFSVNRENLLKKYNELLFNKINGFFVVCDFTTGKYEYVSESIKDNLGYDVSQHSVEELTYLMGSIIHEKHVDVMVNSYLAFFCKYLKENATAATGTDFRTTCCCRLRNIYNVYEWYLLDTAVVQSDDTGFPVTTLITCTNINQFKKDECFYYNIQKKNSDGMYMVVAEGTGSNDFNACDLTPREIQIVNLISQGHSNKKIADELYISVHTVQTHRKRIMKKAKCNGTAELTNFAFSRGLI
jgi:DNA-binding CsgD family transcriptional regulator